MTIKRERNWEKLWIPGLKLADVKVGDKLMTDDGFTCMKAGEIHSVERSEEHDEFFIRCRLKHHGLDGQLREDGTLSGLSRAPADDPAS